MARTFNREAAEREANEIAFQFQNSTDVVGDMSRAYHTDFSGIRIHTDEAADRRVQAAGKDALASGRDIFFGEGIFESQDPASKGLVAHELAHTMQQGTAGGEAQEAVNEYAPAGTEQGGILDWFRSAFKKKPKTQHLGGQKSTDEASLSYMAAMKAREKELVEEKRAAALGGLGAVNNQRPDAALLGRSTDLLPEVVQRSNELWGAADKEKNFTGAVSTAYQALGHRNTKTDVGKNDTALRNQAFQGSKEDYESYLKGLENSGADFQAMQQNQADFQVAGKDYRVNDAIGGMTQDVYSIASRYMLSDGGLDYIENMVNGIGGADVFQEGGMDPLTYALTTIMTGEGIRSTTAMQLGENYSLTGKAGEARSAVAKEANRNVMIPMTMETMSEEERQALPPQIQSLFQQYTNIKKQIADALDARKAAG